MKQAFQLSCHLQSLGLEAVHSLKNSNDIKYCFIFQDKFDEKYETHLEEFKTSVESEKRTYCLDQLR